MLNAKANNHNTINTCIERAKVIAESVGDDHVWIVADQDIYAPGQETVWTRGDDNVHFRLGGLHISDIYMSCIGDHINGSQLSDLWIEAKIATSGEVDKILGGRDYKAGLRLHKITWQAAWRIILPMFFTYLEESDPDMFADIKAACDTQNSYPLLLTRLNTPEFFQSLDAFLSAKKKDKNFAFILTYLDMVQILIAFTRAQRVDDFKLHLNSFARMLGSFIR